MLPKYHDGITLALKSASIAGVNPFNTSISQFLLFLVAIGVLLSHATLTVVYLLVEYNSDRLGMEEILRSYEAGFAIFHAITKLLAMRLNRERFVLLINKSLKFWEIETHYGEQLKAACEASNKFVMTMLYALLTAATGNWIAFNAGAFLFGDEITFLLPIYKPACIPSFVIYVGQNYHIIVIITTLFGHDGILLSCIVMVEVQFKLLNNKLGILFDQQKFHKVDDRAIKKCVNYHNYLLKFIHDTNRTFSLTLLLYQVILILAMCVEFYTVSKRISSAITLKALVYIATMLLQFFSCNSVPGQLLINETEKTSDVVFSNNWEEVSSPSVKCAIKLLLQRSQKPVLILAGGIIPLHLGSGLATLKTITSYYMFLRTVTEAVN